MLTATNIQTSKVYEIQTSSQVDVLLGDNPGALFSWSPVMPANEVTFGMACESPMFERSTLGNYCARCHWTNKLHAAKWHNWK